MNDAPAARIALYSHDAQGLGHIRRQQVVAAALARDLPALIGRPVTGLVVSGTAEAGRLHWPQGWDLLVLPALAKSGGQYVPRQLRIGGSQLGSLRTSVLTSALCSFAPELLVVDKHPAGVGGELRPALAALPGTRMVLGLREILDDAVSARLAWNQAASTEILDAYFDRVWVYGDPLLHDPFASGEIPQHLAAIADFTGYLSRARPDAAPVRAVSPAAELVDERTVLTLVGGGEDGAPLARAAAAAPVPDGLRQLVCTGPCMSDEHVTEVRRVAGSHTTVVRHLDHLPALLARAAGVVTMGGYNTLCEILATDVPALVVPRTSPRAEQLIRARMLASAGLVERADPDIGAEGIGAWMAGLPGRRCARRGVDLDGVRRLAPLAAALLRPQPGSVHVAV